MLHIVGVSVVVYDVGVVSLFRVGKFAMESMLVVEQVSDRTVNYLQYVCNRNAGICVSEFLVGFLQLSCWQATGIFALFVYSIVIM